MKDRQLRQWVHDLRSPLTGITGFAQLIQGSEDAAEMRRWAANIEEAALSLERVIDRVGIDLGNGQPGEMLNGDQH